MLKICLVLAVVTATASGQCDSGWSPFGQSCYRFADSAKSFDAHRGDCEYLGGWLVSITSAEENAFANQLQQAGCSSGTCPTYIGLTRDSAGHFTNWQDAALFDGTAYANWNSEEPNNVGGSENCLELINNNGKWNDISCTNDRQAICEKPPPAAWCGSGWSPFRQCCYRLLTVIKYYSLHSSDCQNSGGKLVSITSAAENSFVQQLQQSGCPDSSCRAAYIGLQRNSAGQFTSWLDGTPFGGSFYANWNGGEPNSVGGPGSEDCGEIVQGTGKWNDIQCSEGRLAVCENCQLPTTTSTTTTTTTPTTTTASTTTTTPTTTTPSTTTPTTTASTTTASAIKPTTSTSTTVGAFDCRTVRTNVNCGAANGPAACDAQCRLFKYGRGFCYSFGTTSCPGYPPGSKGCLCYDTLDCRTLRTQVNCAAANAATSCPNWCKLFQWTQGACTTFTSSWTCPGYAAGQKACLCQ